MGFFVPPQHQPNTVSSSSHFVVTSIWLNVFSDSSWSLHTKGWQFNEQIYNRFSFVSITVRSFARINKTINVVLKFSTHCVHTVVIDRQTEEKKHDEHIKNHHEYHTSVNKNNKTTQRRIERKQNKIWNNTYRIWIDLCLLLSHFNLQLVLLLLLYLLLFFSRNFLNSKHISNDEWTDLSGVKESESEWVRENKTKNLIKSLCGRCHWLGVQLQLQI